MTNQNNDATRIDRRQKALRVIDQYTPGYGHESVAFMRYVRRNRTRAVLGETDNG